MKKICFIGAVNSIHLTKIYENLLEIDKYKLEFITIHNDSSVKFKYKNIAISKKYEKLNYILSILRAKKYLKRFNPDILFTQFATGYGFFTYLLSSVPYILRVQGCDILRLPKVNLLYRFMATKSTKKAVKIISVSKDLTNELLNWGTAPDKIEEFQNGIDFSYFNQQDRKEHCKDVNNIVVLTNREISSIYNYPIILDAFHIVLKKIPQLKFKIIADGSDVNYVKNYIDDKKMNESVFYSSLIPNFKMAYELKNADIYVSASSTDGTSRSLLEAMSCGAFPIVSDISANRNLIIDGENGLLFNCKNSRELADRIILAVYNTELRKKVAKINWKKINKIGSLNSTMKKVISIIDSI